MKKIYIWLLAVAIYLAVFGVPIVTGYIMFAEQIGAKTGGAFFYFVSLIAFLFMLKKINAAIKRQKAGVTKAIFKLTVSLTTLYLSYMIVKYIGLNFDDLANLILITIGGRLLGFFLELLAVRIDKTYLEEIGVV